MFLKIWGVGNPEKIVFELSFEKDAQPHPKMFAKIANMAPKTIQVEGQVGSQIAAKGYPRASLKKYRKRYKKRRRPSSKKLQAGGGPFK